MSAGDMDPLAAQLHDMVMTAIENLRGDLVKIRDRQEQLIADVAELKGGGRTRSAVVSGIVAAIVALGAVLIEALVRRSGPA